MSQGPCRRRHGPVDRGGTPYLSDHETEENAAARRAGRRLALSGAVRVGPSPAVGKQRSKLLLRFERSEQLEWSEFFQRLIAVAQFFFVEQPFILAQQPSLLPEQPPLVAEQRFLRQQALRPQW